MSKIDQGYSRKPGAAARQETDGQLTTPGPYIGIVKNNLDPTRSGRLQVYIPDLGGADENDDSGWYTVSYASPFRGQTSPMGEYVQEAEDKSAGQPENSTQSYGFWMVPPDLNIKVLCIFANSDPAQGYWFACVGDSFDMHMTPGIAAVPPADPLSPEDGSLPSKGGYIWDPAKFETHKMLQDYIELINPSSGSVEIPSRLPVSEPVYARQGGNDGDGEPVENIDRLAKVPQVEQSKRLGIQGLAFDFRRGATSASAVRENPSQVFGFSTPGRLHALKDKATAAKLLGILKQVQDGSVSAEDDAFAKKVLSSNYRVGGHQFVMDDGTVDGMDAGIRIRSAAGNMILLDDTNEQIYIINARGTAWVELSPSGRIDMFSTEDFSVHTEGNFNVHADKDINLHAGNKLKMFAESGIKIESKNDLTQRVATETTLHSGAGFGIGAGGSLELSTGSVGSFTASSDLILKGATTFINTKPGNIISAPEPIEQNNLVKTGKVSPRQVWWQTGTLRSITPIAPMHEPWTAHEVDTIQSSVVEKGKAGPGRITRPDGGNEPGAVNEADISQAVPVGDGVCNLTKGETQALLACIAKHESGKQGYNCENSIGYCGKYQFGVEALIDAGFVKRSAFSGPYKGYHKAILGNPTNWTGKMGVDSKAHWKQNGGAQEAAMITIMNANCKQLKRLGVITDSTPHDAIGGFLMCSHLLGAGGALKYSKFLKGQGAAPKPDAYGTSAEKYYNEGKRAVKLGASVAST